MAVHIERERSVTIIKHDLFAPLRMIEDEVTDITRSLQQGGDISGYSLPNLSAATMIAKNLVDMLDADPEEALRSFDPQPTGLEGDIVARVKTMLGHYAKVANRMKIDFAPIRDLIPRLYIDRGLVERTLCNLILNAVKYGRRGSTILVVPREETSWYCLDVINEGIGVEASEATRIFRGRYRGANARKAGKTGLGLGLKISRAAMEKHQGRLLLTSNSKEATVFTMQFPKRLELQPRESIREKGKND
jgi:signal transduction histidine kinase